MDRKAIDEALAPLFAPRNLRKSSEYVAITLTVEQFAEVEKVFREEIIPRLGVSK